MPELRQYSHKETPSSITLIRSAVRHRTFIRIRDFEIASRTVTVAEYAQFARPPLPYAYDDEPVTGVSWFDAVAFCEW